jgi:pilus assembly protein CpaE
MTAMELERPVAPTLTLAALKNRFAALERTPSLYSLPAAKLRLLARRARSEFAASGTLLFRQGEPAENMYVILSGRCQMSVTTGAANPVAVDFARAGDIMGEESAVLGEPRLGSVRALEDSELLSIDRDAIEVVLEQDSEEMAELVKLVRQRHASMSMMSGWSQPKVGADLGQSVAVYSPKGGAGRTTVALNLAAQLARSRPGETVVVDLSLPFNNVALMSNLVPVRSLAMLSRFPAEQFEEGLLSATLPHPAGFIVLPAVLRAEEAELVTAELVSRAIAALQRSFPFVVLDLPSQLSEVTLAVLERADRILVLATSELSMLKDFKDVRRILQEVLRVPHSRVMVALNHRTPRGVIDRAAVERTVGQPLLCEFPFEGPKLDETAVRGEILSVTDPRGPMARATALVATALAGGVEAPAPAEKQGRRQGRRIFGLG